MNFGPFGDYVEEGQLIQTGRPSPVRYIITGTWRVRENLFIVKIGETSIESMFPEKSALWGYVDSIEGGVMKMRPFNGGGSVKARRFDRYSLLPSESDDSVLSQRSAVDHIFGVPVVGTIPEPPQKEIEDRIIPKQCTSVMIGMRGVNALEQNPGLDQKGNDWGWGRVHNGVLKDSVMFARWAITLNLDRVRQVDFSGPGKAITADDVETCFQWLETRLGDATKSFARNLNTELKGYEAIGAYWAKPEAIIVLSLHVGGSDRELYTSLTINPASRDLAAVTNVESIVYGDGTPVGRKALHGNWARDMARLP
jgi:hypothetical protein